MAEKMIVGSGRRRGSGERQAVMMEHLRTGKGPTTVCSHEIFLYKSTTKCVNLLMDSTTIFCYITAGFLLIFHYLVLDYIVKNILFLLFSIFNLW